ncbi:hypothetical protein CAL14_12350 [Bordetella genomosp. 9]|nr:hypothetical protein CAL14_12350 [Bordetella genomosp. 9]
MHLRRVNIVEHFPVAGKPVPDCQGDLMPPVGVEFIVRAVFQENMALDLRAGILLYLQDAAGIST